MTIEQVSENCYRIRKMVKGKLYMVSVDHKPTEKEAILLIADKMSFNIERKELTFEEAAHDYIDSKNNVLSPRSVREYTLYINRLPLWFINKNVYDIGQKEVTKCINELSAGKAPKTVRSLHGFISAVIGSVNPSLKLTTTLPQKVKNEPYIPTNEDVKKVLAYTDKKNDMFYVPIALAAYGLRRSEILALTVNDLSEDNMLTINKAIVENIDNEWVVKTTKTTASTRTIPIDESLADRIRKQGYVYNGAAQSISNFLDDAEKKLGIEHFSIHKLRHYYASHLLMNNVSMKDVMYLGGWETDTVLKEVYAHAMKAKEEEGRRDINSLIAKAIF